MSNKILLITPPFTQLNTPYPATPYLKGFLKTLGKEVHQADLGIEVILKLFTAKGLKTLFQKIDDIDLEVSDNSFRIFQLQNEYIHTIEPVIRFLQNKNPTLAHSICDRNYLPEASRFAELDDLEWAFGTMGTHDKARHLATLYLEDLGDLITETIDSHFGFSRYAERLGRTATHFDEMQAALNQPNSFISEILLEILDAKIKEQNPDLVCITVPFPGNLFGAFKCGQFLKKNYPNIHIAMGGGFCNTELRSLKDPRVFDYLDFISLDDGEAPLKILLEYLAGKRAKNTLKRTYYCEDGKVIYQNSATEKDIAQRETGTPDYSELPIHDYLSVIELVNPMHRLWSDGRWNKLTLAHGCYWGKCSFCDISLDYIKNYEPLTAALLCDRIEEIIAQTQQNGFHFVDEAAPPALMRDLAIEIIRRKLTVVWWANIRFEKSFTLDLAKLLKASGCIALSGGLEVASDRLLEKMKKGVTVSQVAQVCDNFTQAGIMVHAYLMYGFPTQTAQETIDSLEMVRQMFEQGILQSGFWHQFAMTSHSPVGMNPAEFDVLKVGPEFGDFADNDLFHDDPKGAKHEKFSEGLKKSLFNYMHGIGFDMPLHKWFDNKVPTTTIPKNYIERCLKPHLNPLQSRGLENVRPNSLILWLGNLPSIEYFEIMNGKKPQMMAEISFIDKKSEWILETDAKTGKFLEHIFPKLILSNEHNPLKFSEFQSIYEQSNLGDMNIFLQSPIYTELKSKSLLIL